MTPAALSAGRPGDPALVFLHGVGGDGSSFAPQLTHFAASHHCLAWHMPGYGGSDMLDPYGWPALADALVALLDAHGIDRAAVVGHSIGGMVLQAALQRHPTRISAAVLSATSPAFGKRDGDFQRAFLTARLAPLDRGERLADLAPGIVDSLLGESPAADARARAIACMGAVPEPAYRAAMTAITTFDAREGLAAIACPTLVLAGERDSNAPHVMMARMAEKIPGAQFACLDGAGHLAYLEQPARFNRCVADFLSTRAAGA
ncbi:MAG: alpha/beta fold hydrolase [Pseudomonadota bacterium]